MRVDLAFARDYSLAAVEALDQFRSGWEFPPGRQVDPATVGGFEQTVTYSVAGKPDVVGPTFGVPAPVCVAVRPDRAESWLGMFHPIITSARDTNAVVALPDGETFAVVSHGSVYRAWVEAPARWEKISPGGVHDPVIAPDLELVAFADHNTLIAYGVNGLAWESERLVLDDLRPLRLEGEMLWMEGFDGNEIVPFTVDLRSGRSCDASDR